MACTSVPTSAAAAASSYLLLPLSLNVNRSRPSSSLVPFFTTISSSHCCLKHSPPLLSSSSPHKEAKSSRHLCRAAAEYEFPDPIPDFADAETDKFKTHLHAKLLKKDIYGGSVHDVLAICTEIFSTFLHTEYGGPGTLLVVPFIDMADTINERGLPGGPQAARSAVVWAQKHVDKDWKEWTGSDD